ncbi:Aste57867_5837 [Aphanomyces stellatus]|uniref:Aste57867_5837 protein n=1 Tax=Aphanomyces stellatus TaxID=120398 RepID=A0A485KHJ7_9STRA|nr:hypothetical protein As57867_005823 [Aphanomyces stellatus]VFT82860.1 Aste57867_5837 [Aphanomyces stellatus]
MAKALDLRRPTFTVRDGFHLAQVNTTKSNEVERQLFPELVAATPPTSITLPRIPSTDSVTPATPLSQPSILHCPPTFMPDTPQHRRKAMMEATPITSWLIFRESPPSQTLRPSPLLLTPETDSSSSDASASARYAQPHRHVRHRRVKPASRTSLLPQLPIPTPRQSPSPMTTTRRRHLETANSLIRLRTTLPVADPHTTSLGARILHFKIAPHELEAIVKKKEARKQQRIVEHGVNLVARNKRMVVKPRSQSNQDDWFEQERRRQEESKQRQEAHQALMMEITVAGVDRWGTRRKKEELVRARQVWAKKMLWIIAIGKAAHRLHAYYRAAEGRIMMNQKHRATRRIQHFWRRKSQAICLSHVTHAMLIIQKHVLRWIERRRVAKLRTAVLIIIMSIEELQEAKFRRCILKYRHCIHAFQSMWRGWTSITECRIKLLVLLWARVEKKFNDKAAAADPLRVKTPEATAVSSTTPSSSQPSSRSNTKRRNDLRPMAPTGPNSRGGGAPRAGSSAAGFSDTVRLLEHLNSLKQWTTSGQVSSRGAGRSRGTGSRIPLTLKVSMLKSLLRKKRQAFLTQRLEQKEMCENQLELRRRRGVGMDASTVLALDNLRFEKTHFLMLKAISEDEIMALVVEADRLTNQKMTGMLLGLDGITPRPPTSGISFRDETTHAQVAVQRPEDGLLDDDDPQDTAK